MRKKVFADMMDFTIELEDMVAMLVSIVCGGIIGFEREYRSNSAGFRTIILISLGSTIFTIVSRHGAGTDDRISANIITGIGFIGAGVIFKDKFSVSGLTTAAVIWTSAAIGMTTGISCTGTRTDHALYASDGYQNRKTDCKPAKRKTFERDLPGAGVFPDYIFGGITSEQRPLIRKNRGRKG